MGLFCETALNLLNEKSYLSTKKEVEVFGPGAKLRLIKIVLYYWDLLLGKQLRGVLPVPKHLHHLGKRAEAQ